MIISFQKQTANAYSADMLNQFLLCIDSGNISDKMFGTVNLQGWSQYCGDQFG